MIDGVSVRELDSSLDATGQSVALWNGEGLPGSLFRSSFRTVFPGIVEAWFSRERARERITCLEGTIKLVLCDRRDGSATSGEVMEIFLGEYRFREVIVPPGVLRGWKAVGGRNALIFQALEGEESAPQFFTLEEADVPYDWEIVMQ
ncbi:MAG: dTDP-4-dehydrorhamnose 3,5-epimerase family protein [Actinobacteria bacterium]|nr:dTDP-4-dehydrorhamnose 3,5-epimerase family protein [Actinomycetota bacterium]